jgi:hypothetical protein
MPCLSQLCFQGISNIYACLLIRNEICMGARITGFGSCSEDLLSMSSLARVGCLSLCLIEMRACFVGDSIEVEALLEVAHVLPYLAPRLCTQLRVVSSLLLPLSLIPQSLLEDLLIDYSSGVPIQVISVVRREGRLGGNLGLW